MAYCPHWKEGYIMKIVFQNSVPMTCIFTDEGISLYSKSKEAFYPYGCIKSLKMNFMGILILSLGDHEVTYGVEEADRPRVREAVKQAHVLMKTAAPGEPRIYSRSLRVSPKLPPEEQLQQYKQLYISGTLTKDHYDLIKRLLKA